MRIAIRQRLIFGGFFWGGGVGFRNICKKKNGGNAIKLLSYLSSLCVFSAYYFLAKCERRDKKKIG